MSPSYGADTDIILRAVCCRVRHVAFERHAAFCFDVASRRYAALCLMLARRR